MEHDLFGKPGRAKQIIKENNFNQLYTDLDTFGEEIKDFVSDIMGKAEDDMLIIKIGFSEDSELMLNDLYAKIQSDD